MESAFKGNDAVAFGMIVRRLVFTCHLDRAFHRLGAGIAEEHHVREARFAQTLRDALGFGNLIEIGDVPYLLRLLGQSRDKLRMSVTQGVDRNAGREIEIAIAVCRNEPSAFAPLKSEVDARIGR